MDSFGRYGLCTFQLIGVVLSALLLVFTFTHQDQLEQQIQIFAVTKVDETTEKIVKDVSGKLERVDQTGRFGELSQRLGNTAELAEQRRRQIVPAILSMELSDDCHANCEYWEKASEFADSLFLARIAQLKVGQDTLQDFIRKRYDETIRGMLLDLRIFSAVNVVALSLVIGFVLLREHLNWRFYAFSAALTGYIAWASYGYVFQQDWGHTILFHDWAAPGYQITMILVSLALVDLLFLRGVISNAILSAVSCILPC